MTRTLILIAIVSFVLAVGCFAGAFAIAGGPFSIDDGWRFHRLSWHDQGGNDRTAPPSSPAPPSPPAPTGPQTPPGRS
jgi:hypothetical protein